MATRTAIPGRSRAVWTSPALVDGLLAYAVAMAVGVAVFTGSVERQPGSWPAYLFALGFGLILLLRRRRPVLVLILTSLGICEYYTLEYPPIGLALPIAAALFSAAEAGQARIESAAPAARDHSNRDDQQPAQLRNDRRGQVCDRHGGEDDRRRRQADNDCSVNLAGTRSDEE